MDWPVISFISKFLLTKLITKLLKQKSGHALIIFCCALFVIGAALVFSRGYFSNNVYCVTETKDEEVLGSSMEPLIKDHSKIKALYGYYGCNAPKRDDIVLYYFLHNQYPLLKRIVAMPSDTFQMQAKNSRWNLVVNGSVVTNSESKEYLLDDRAKTLLNLYRDQYSGILPANIYIILGDQVGGTLDSSRFGVVDGKDFIAKAQVAF